MDLTVRYVSRIIGSRRGLKILDVGFGKRKENRDIELLAEKHPFNEFYGIDLHFHGSRVEKTVGNSKVILDKGNICKEIPKGFPKEFDVIYSAAVIHLLRKGIIHNCRKKALKVIAKHLKHGGTFVLIDLLNKKVGDKLIEKYYEAGELDKLVSKYFHIIMKETTVQHDIGHSHDVAIYICKRKLI